MSTTAQRRGACPSLSAPMQTGDGLLVRLNTVDGAISPRQLGEVARAAGRFGNGLLEITARGSLQIRGLTAASAPLLAAFVDGLDLAVRDGVPVETAPLAGLDPEEIVDPRPLTAAIREGVARLGLAARLGPKVSVVVDGGGRSMLDVVKADVRLAAERGSGTAVWRLALAGDGEGARYVGSYAEADACEAALSRLSAIAALGKAARAKDLLRSEMAHSLAPPSVLPDISPTCGEITSVADAAFGRAVAFKNYPSVLESGATDKLPISPRVGEMSGRTEGGAQAQHGTGECSSSSGDRSASILTFGTPIPLSDSRFAVRVALPFGSVDAATLERFSDALAALGIAELRLCPERSLLSLCPTEAQAGAAHAAAKGAGLITDLTDPRLAIVACAGAPACASGHYATKPLAETIARDMPELLSKGSKLHLSGCDKRCAEPSGRSIAVIGREDGCAIVANGTSVPPALREYLARRGAVSAHDRKAS